MLVGDVNIRLDRPTDICSVHWAVSRARSHQPRDIADARLRGYAECRCFTSRPAAAARRRAWRRSVRPPTVTTVGAVDAASSCLHDDHQSTMGTTWRWRLPSGVAGVHLCVSVIRGQRSTSTTWLSSTTTASRRYSTIFYLRARYDVNVVHRTRGSTMNVAMPNGEFVVLSVQLGRPLQPTLLLHTQPGQLNGARSVSFSRLRKCAARNRVHLSCGGLLVSSWVVDPFRPVRPLLPLIFTGS